ARQLPLVRSVECAATAQLPACLGQLGAQIRVEWCPVEQPAQPLFEAGDESHRAGYAHEAARSVKDLPDGLGYALGWDLSWLARYPAGARRPAVGEIGAGRAAAPGPAVDTGAGGLAVERGGVR